MKPPALLSQDDIETLPSGRAIGTAFPWHTNTSRIGDGQPRLSDVAQAMSMSTRSLQRRLGEEGVSFTAVVSQVRLSLAAGHLAQKNLAISEIAFLLGYSSLGACHRAFKRAHGCTPAAYRQARSG